MADTTEPGTAAPRIRAVVLAAGAGSRFGGSKLEARVDGKPVLQHVLDALAEAGLGDAVVVVADPPPVGIDWGAAELVTNADPARGLSSSLQLGWSWAMARVPRPDAILLALGDQPLLRADVVRTLVAEPLDASRPLLAIRYSDHAARNPVRIEAAAEDLVAAGYSDMGLGPHISEHPELLRLLEIDGTNPDVDRRADLADVADTMWAQRVRGNREQVDRLREEPDGPDFYAKVSSIFRDDPDRTGDPVLDALRSHARPSDTWLDIGAGAGRYALPLARVVERVIALDPSRSMLEGLREGMSAHQIENVHVIESRWPEAILAAGQVAAEGETLAADVSLIAHVGYDVEAIWPFVEAMEHATTRECLAILMERSPAAMAEPFWPEIHGERRISLPALPAFVDLLSAHGRQPSVQLLESARRTWASREEIEGFVRRQTWVRPGSRKDHRMQALLDRWLVRAADGTWELSIGEPLQVGLVAWEPGLAAR
ncbi:MAG TPA: NTP transferase domain-containing protein [Candidatus Limnocylindrales bacterium]|nr:NTP transferase domain-containing protein [Candidatus Limnocylindrales bacterium]